jgi:uncharacterized SAM-binding protein YcdF (DUF218 family)
MSNNSFMAYGKPKRRRRWLWFLLFLGFLWLLHGWLLTGLGSWLVRDDPVGRSEAVVVLSTGIDYYPRLMEAARLVREGLATTAVINGNRKSPALRELEQMGYQPERPWYTESVRILEVLGVPNEQVLPISAENAYDTISEARKVGGTLVQLGFRSITLATSRYHTRRAGHIWEQQFGDQMEIRVVAASEDPFRADGWWRSGRQIRSLLAEYGAWGFLAYQSLGSLD